MGKGLIHRLDDKDRQRWALGLLTDLCQHDKQALGLGIRLYVLSMGKQGNNNFLGSSGQAFIWHYCKELYTRKWGPSFL